jgi:hypothetical protein
LPRSPVTSAPRVGGQGQPATSLPATRAKVSDAEQRGKGADGVAAPQGHVCGLLEQAGDLLVGRDGRFGEVPGAALGTIRELDQHRVDAATLVAGRQLHHRRPGERMAEHQPAVAKVDLHQPRPFRRAQVLDPTLAGHGAPQHAKIASAIQGGQQQQVTRGSGQATHPRREQRLQAPAQGQHHGQRPGALRATK